MARIKWAEMAAGQSLIQELLEVVLASWAA
jgi:hypothetical protein